MELDTSENAVAHVTSSKTLTQTTPPPYQLSYWLQRQCEALQIHRPTLIQRLCIPLVQNGYSCICISPTGTGKTACYVWPILEKLSKSPQSYFALILLPSRELADQVIEQIRLFGCSVAVRMAICVGGASRLAQVQQLIDMHPHIVIGTPGRLAHFLQTTPEFQIKIKACQMIVFDEADRLFDTSFENDLNIIFTHINPLIHTTSVDPSAKSQNVVQNKDSIHLHNPTTSLKDYSDAVHRQLIFVTATFSPELKYLHNLYAQKGRPLILCDPSTSHSVSRLPDSSKLQHFYIFLPARIHLVYLWYLISETFKQDNIIIFTRSCRRCQHLATTLELLGANVSYIHALLNTRRRIAGLAKFRSSHSRILVATDLASRGLDLPKVTWVINYDFPRTRATYIHRVGRTARAGRQGSALSFVAPKDVPRIHKLEKTILKSTPMNHFDIEEDKALVYLKMATEAYQKASQFLEEIGFFEKADILSKQRKSDIVKQVAN